MLIVFVVVISAILKLTKLMTSALRPRRTPFRMCEITQLHDPSGNRIRDSGYESDLSTNRRGSGLAIHVTH